MKRRHQLALAGERDDPRRTLQLEQTGSIDAEASGGF
jgi:hypothetical protein